MDEFEIREKHGVMSAPNQPASVRDGCVEAREDERYVVVGMLGYELRLLPDAAHRLANMLHRLARRIEVRTDCVGDGTSSRAGE